MASRSKQKTTMAKLARERLLRERRVEKQAKKDERKRQATVAPDAASHVNGIDSPGYEE
jgi:hypothetical protein